MKTLSVPGMHCSKCVARIEAALAKAGIDGRVELESKTVTVPEDRAAEVIELLDDLGEVTVDAPATTVTLPEGVRFEGATLSLKSETTLSLYFLSDTQLSFGVEGKTVDGIRFRAVFFVKAGFARADIQRPERVVTARS